MKQLSLLLCLAVSAAADESALWRQFRDATDRAPSTVLPDFSYAGYRHGEEAIPDVQGPLFNVRDFGAVPDDAGSDEEAIRGAIAAAEAAGGGVVCFPGGTYLLWTDRLRIRPLTVGRSGIVLRGAGSSERGKVLHFVHHGLTAGDYHVPKSGADFQALRYFVHVEAPEPAVKEPEVRVTEETARGSFRLSVADAKGFRPGQWVSLSCGGATLSEELLAGQTAPEAWKRARAGVVVFEHHQIRVVDRAGTVFGCGSELFGPKSGGCFVSSFCAHFGVDAG